jgi:hypothetical protein
VPAACGDDDDDDEAPAAGKGGAAGGSGGAPAAGGFAGAPRAGEGGSPGQSGGAGAGGSAGAAGGAGGAGGAPLGGCAVSLAQLQTGEQLFQGKLTMNEVVFRVEGGSCVESTIETALDGGRVELTYDEKLSGSGRYWAYSVTAGSTEVGSGGYIGLSSSSSEQTSSEEETATTITINGGPVGVWYGTPDCSEGSGLSLAVDKATGVAQLSASCSIKSTFGACSGRVATSEVKGTVAYAGCGE